MRTPVIGGLRSRLEASLDRAGIDLPWWIPTAATGLGITFVVVAIAQRAAVLPAWMIVLVAVLAAATAVAWFLTGRIMPSWLKSILVVGAVAVLLAHPVVPDFSPVMLVILVAEMGAIARPVIAAGATAGGIAVLVVAGVWGGLVGGPVYVVAVVLGYSAGVTLRWYVRALGAERGKQDAVREQATLAERQRIAREVHDVVGHSLSITLLYLTGARRALQQDRDVDEAVEALTEAERVGRSAMNDIRRAVGLLGNVPSRKALPGIADIGTLVERTRAAGVDVRYEQHGDLGSVGPSAGLGLYRIAQESLANIAKHAPDTTARFRLLVEPHGTRLTVRNRLPLGATTTATNGAGLAGMADRAAGLGAELTAGPDGEYWVVDVTVPGEPVSGESDAEARTS